MPGPFETTLINGLALSNRFIRSATWTGMASKEGASTSRLSRLMAGLAQGGVGLIMTGHAYIRAEGQAGPWQLGVHHDELIPGLKEMTRAVHDAGGRIALQIAHAGLFARHNITGLPQLAPTELECYGDSPIKAMTADDISSTVKAFGEAALRAKKAGFDGIQVHAAHGYLLSQFLSPAFNRRCDRYGGPVENRARILLEVLTEIRGKVGGEFPVMVKMNSRDFMEGGLRLEESVKAGQLLEQNGVDAIELSGGTPVSGDLFPSRGRIVSREKEAYFKDAAKEFKKNLDVPLILVGGIRSYEVTEELLQERVADYISMSRPFIREPDLINRWKRGNRQKAKCVSDNQCFGPGMAGEGVYCVTEKEEKEKAL